jgi:hypothetical protein
MSESVENSFAWELKNHGTTRDYHSLAAILKHISSATYPRFINEEHVRVGQNTRRQRLV